MTFSVAGFRFAGCAAGIKKAGGLDLGLIVADQPVVAAGVFTRNLVRAAPVDVSIERLRLGRARAVLANSGNANACTGAEGMAATLASTQAAAGLLGLEATQVLPASTGVIGSVLPAAKLEAALPGLVERLSADGAEEFAKAICTTDRWHKIAHGTLKTAGGPPASVLGIVKGAGMIHPDLGPAPTATQGSGPLHATMLAFFVTDAKVERSALQSALERAVELSFNACSVDGDTSTNDTVLALASGLAGPANEAALFEGLLPVCRELAKQMVLDGEGAQHAVEIRVEGLADDAAARTVAKAVATSLLVKTALFGKDANWGRLLAAAGRAGVAFDPGAASVSIAGSRIFDKGKPLGAAAEAVATRGMTEPSYGIVMTLGNGPGSFTYLTCDLGHGYVDVNAGYRS
ncbi:MAG TPA: bifunctional glutamate N-acetyltransferase/amino-acid acetyltransferase ArgJ [Polyangiaceae bacterium]